MASQSELVKVLRALEKQRTEGTGWTWVRRIARLTGLHYETVRRMVDGPLAQAVEFADAEPLIGEGLRIRPIRLKDGVTAEGHLRWLRAMGRL